MRSPVRRRRNAKLSLFEQIDQGLIQNADGPLQRCRHVGDSACYVGKPHVATALLKLSPLLRARSSSSKHSTPLLSPKEVSQCPVVSVGRVRSRFESIPTPTVLSLTYGELSSPLPVPRYEAPEKDANDVAFGALHDRDFEHTLRLPKRIRSANGASESNVHLFCRRP